MNAQGCSEWLFTELNQSVCDEPNSAAASLAPSAARTLSVDLPALQDMAVLLWHTLLHISASPAGRRHVPPAALLQTLAAPFTSHVHDRAATPTARSRWAAARHMLVTFARTSTVRVPLAGRHARLPLTSLSLATLSRITHLFLMPPVLLWCAGTSVALLG
jgi:hypothetical protein